ncbi:MAG: hypothetical protein ACXIUM_00410 [Wenzhouxiangella sp.]
MAKPNYQYSKRQRELKKAQQQEEKRQKKLARNAPAEELPSDSAEQKLDQDS